MTDFDLPKYDDFVTMIQRLERPMSARFYPAPRSVPAQRPPAPRSAPAPLPSVTPAHRSAPAQPIIGPLRSGFPLRSHALPTTLYFIRQSPEI